jgi:hypothetical protein
VPRLCLDHEEAVWRDLRFQQMLLAAVRTAALTSRLDGVRFRRSYAITRALSFGLADGGELKFH